MDNNKLKQLIEEHKPEKFYHRAQVRNVGEREKIEVDDAEIYVRHFEWVISSDRVDLVDSYMDPETTLPQFALDAAEGRPIMVNHNYQPLPVGRSTGGEFDNTNNIVTATGYIQEGLTDVNSDDVISRLLAGTAPDASVGYEGESVCNFDGTPFHWFWDECEYGHHRGEELHLDADGNETEILDEIVDTFVVYEKIINGRLLEFSPVWLACNPDAQLIRGIRGLYKAGDIGDDDIKSLTKRFRYDFKSMLGNRKTYIPSKRRKKMATNDVTTEEYNEVVEELQTANQTIADLRSQLEARPKQEEVDQRINTLNEELEGKDATIATLTNERDEASSSVDDLDLGLRLLRQDVLDEYAAEQGLTKWGRESDENYNELKKSLENVVSIGALIRKRKRYSPIADTTGERQTTRKSQMSTDELDKYTVPTPGMPGIGAYSE